ncbi:acyltransferase [Flexilinea flocculi]|jgi:UDP-2-acetamido-3-amino-2,3-dideoxy-glucuronate N-acetyltransferase|uniref:Bacterial transferase hexapeptide n=1 Tax=Flexilinea flocculi TaxID=1678840 RepID=A0A0K8PA50_9CHLR|nr:acyltransferase [Flexilinea flocculi]GAP39394.1 bacterial transferase hexapeptide [Flexilinea flocculi]
MSDQPYIDPSAHVSEKAKIGKQTKVWINAQIREDAEIGENCIISKDVYIDHAVKIGNRVKIQNGVSVFNGVTIEDDVFIGPNVAFTNDYYPRAFNQDWEVSETLVKKGASIGANATIVCRHTLGEYCMVGAGSVVTSDVKPYTLVVGNPAREIGKVCRCGTRVYNHLVCPKCGFDLKSAGVEE